MNQPRKVLICGDTLVLGGLRANLAVCPGIELICIEEAIASEEQLAALRPNLILFDIEAVHPTTLYELTWQLPGLRLFGIDPSANRVVIWSRQQLSDLSTRDLVAMIVRGERTIRWAKWRKQSFGRVIIFGKEAT